MHITSKGVIGKRTKRRATTKAFVQQVQKKHPEMDDYEIIVAAQKSIENRGNYERK